jgi:hypothetical protein
MKISYFAEQTAQQSDPIWKAFLESCKDIGIFPVEKSLDADCALIWSVLWRGRMQKNQQVYEHYRKLNKPVFIAEVGSLIRGKTWKICVNNLTNDGIYANTDDFIPNRHKKLGIELVDHKPLPDLPVLITGQHTQSLQWTAGLSLESWILQKIKEIRKHSDRKILVRPHPREKLNEIKSSNVFMDIPIKIPNSYDDYNLAYKYQMIINFNSGVGIKAAINGCPINVDRTSLASSVGMEIHEIENSYIPDRSYWFEQVVHTEWTVDEIKEGIPLRRLLNKVNLTSST